MENEEWTRAADIIVVGFGYAGAISSIVAHDLGNVVLLLEKMPYFGGNSILSGGDFRITNDPMDALKYLKRTSMNTVPEDVLKVIANGFCEIQTFIEGLQRKQGLEFALKYSGGTYHFDGSESLGILVTKGLKGFDGYPSLITGPANKGQFIFRAIENEVRERGIEVMFSTPVRELVTRNRNEVIGVLAENKGMEFKIKARKGVILACGGFEHNEQMKLQFFSAQPVYGICSTGNTGDGIVMAQKLGAQLWHMWHFHGSYGFKHPNLPVALRHRFGGGRDRMGVVGMPWIIIDKFGNRYMNEQPRAPQDTPWRDMSFYDANVQDYPRIPSYMVIDEDGRNTGPLFVSHAHDPDHSYNWSNDNSVEIGNGWIEKAETVSELATKIGVTPMALEHTIMTWNTYCVEGKDKAFDRPRRSMMSIKNPPYYAVRVWPIVTNTQGGLAHNAKQQVIDVEGMPIPHLYVAGELSSIFGHLYLQAGNDSECIVAGRLSAKYASGEQPWA